MVATSPSCDTDTGSDRGTSITAFNARWHRAGHRLLQRHTAYHTRIRYPDLRSLNMPLRAAAPTLEKTASRRMIFHILFGSNVHRARAGLCLNNSGPLGHRRLLRGDTSDHPLQLAELAAS